MPTYYVDTINGNDANAGDSFAAGHPWKTIKKTFAAGDEVLVAKTAETAQAGTVTATNGSITVDTTNDLSAAIAVDKYVRIGGDDTIYLVRAITSSVITLWRPYRGETGSGKGLTYLNPAAIASLDFDPAAMVGNSGSHITLKGGVNTSTLEQDGFTVLFGNGVSYGMYGTITFTDITRFAMLHWNYPFYNSFNDCTFNKMFFALAGNGPSGIWTRCSVEEIVTEKTSFPKMLVLVSCEVDGIESGTYGTNVGLNFAGNVTRTTLRNLRSATASGMPGLRIAGDFIDVDILDPILDELASGCRNVELYGNQRHTNLRIINPTFGAGGGVEFQSINYLEGELPVINVNGDPTDQRLYVGRGEANVLVQRSYDAAVYHTAAPSAKVTLEAGTLVPGTLPYAFTHFIPCEASVEKTVSVWFRKNSSYGASTRPTMRLIWFTGTSGALTRNIHDVTMTDVDDTWEEVSYAVTPGVQGTIEVQLIFQSANSGAIAWYDDLGAV